MLFRVYFHVHPRVPKASYRLIEAPDLEAAKARVDGLMAGHAEALGRIGFELAGVTLDGGQSFEDYLKGLLWGPVHDGSWIPDVRTP